MRGYGPPTGWYRFLACVGLWGLAACLAMQVMLFAGRHPEQWGVTHATEVLLGGLVIIALMRLFKRRRFL
jgi:hypothetical protein